MLQFNSTVVWKIKQDECTVLSYEHDDIIKITGKFIGAIDLLQKGTTPNEIFSVLNLEITPSNIKNLNTFLSFFEDRSMLNSDSSITPTAPLKEATYGTEELGTITVLTYEVDNVYAVFKMDEV